MTSVTDALKALDTIGNDKIIFSTNLLGNNEQWRAVDSIKHCKKGIVEKIMTHATYGRGVASFNKPWG